jgi:hypothetical protein
VNSYLPSHLAIAASPVPVSLLREVEGFCLMKLIPLTQGKFAIVDDDDFERLSQYKWQLGSNGYPQRAVRTPKGWRPRRMHHDIMTAPPGLVHDHKFGNVLDHQKKNLRLATRSQNQHNQRKRTRKATSRFKGVYWAADIGRWRAHIKAIKGQPIISLGCYLDEAEAAKAYDRAAAQWFGEFARLNFP